LFDNPLGEHRHAELDPAGMAGRAHFPFIDLDHLAAGLEKNPGLKKKNQPSGFFGFFKIYICPEERAVFRVFQFQEYF
jgi:hypothetical protein